MSNTPLLALDDVHAGYGKGHVLRGVSLTVDEGEVVAMLGRNGAGKTTTLRSITGIVRPHQGTITFEGEDITTLPDYAISRRGLSYVAEERSIFPDFTVAENLRMGQVKGGEGIFTLSEVYDLLPRLEERQSNLASHLSGGEQQMLVIARALLGRTKLLLLDEPTEGLAPQIVEDILDIIKRIRDEGVPILLVEQNFNAVMEIADRNYILNKGKIVFDGTTAELQANDEAQQRYLGVGTSINDAL